MKKVILYFALLLMFTVNNGCSKYLETAPDQRAVLDSPEKISELLTSAYPQASYAAFAESMSDNAADKGNGAVVFSNYDPWTFSDVRDRNQDTPDFYWHQSYKAISVANRALSYIESVDNPSLYQAQKGEALVARAYAHFMLVTFFANVYNPYTANTDPGIPYVTENEEQLLLKYQRNTVAYVYEQIEKDLLEGIPLLDDSKYKAPKFHFTKSAAYAFASRFYLFKKDYAQVVTYANLVFGADNLVNNIRSINDEESRQREYYSAQAYYTESSNPSNLLLVEVPTNWGYSFPSVRFGLNSALLSDLFFKANVTGGSYAYMIYGSEFSYNIPKFRLHAVRSSLDVDYGLPYNMVPIFSADEVLMNRAEAYAMLGNSDNAIDDLNSMASKKIIYSQDIPYYIDDIHRITENKLLTHYRAKEMKSALVQAVLDFKRVEYIFEGMRYLDILRHKIPVLHKNIDGTVEYFLGPNDPRRVLQLPQEVVMSGIEPNPR